MKLQQVIDGRKCAFARTAEPSEYSLWALPELAFDGLQPTPCKSCRRRGFLSTVGIASREYAASDGVGILFGQRVRCNFPRDDGRPCGEFKSWDAEARMCYGSLCTLRRRSLCLLPRQKGAHCALGTDRWQPAS